MKHCLFIGTCKKKPDCGESIKNHHIISALSKYYGDLVIINTLGIKKRPLRLVRLLMMLLVHPNIKVIVSASTFIAYPFFKILYCLKKNNVFYWVIGGTIQTRLQEGTYKIKYYRNLSGILVESLSMKRTLEDLGLRNVSYVPNFKPITYYPSKSIKENEQFKFVFLSRIHPEKGCEIIINAVEKLNDAGYQDKFLVDFYGPIDAQYGSFINLIEKNHNTCYKGFMDLSTNEGYDKLAGYDVMLFPTFWSGEGFPGILIDSMIAGLPVIASDWAYNQEILDVKSSIIIRPKDIDALCDAMIYCINHREVVISMSSFSQKQADMYSTSTVLAEDNLIKIGLL